MSNKPTGVIAGALLALVSAVTVLLNVFGITHWTDAQTAAVTAEAATSVALIGAAYAHFRKGTSKEPAILLGALSAWLTTSVAVVSAFVDSLTSTQVAGILGVCAAVVGLLTALFVRRQVVPMKYAPDAPDPAFVAAQENTP
jgi:hypothetical protein